MNRFSYEEYRKIVDIVRKNSNIVDYRDILNNNLDKFCIFRHDVEFSIQRALDLAKLESELDLQSSYFFQLTNNCYNVVSAENLKKIREINNLGHKIGVHTFISKERDYKKIVDIISRDIETLQRYVEIDIDRFSYHRPNLYKEVLEMNIKIDGIINAYSDEFFTYRNGSTNNNRLWPPDVKYISDSQHKWNYGNPLDIEVEKWDKLQLLLHEYSWTRNGFDSHNNFISLIEERNKELLYSIDNECKHFPKELL